MASLGSMIGEMLGGAKAAVGGGGASGKVSAWSPDVLTAWKMYTTQTGTTLFNSTTVTPVAAVYTAFAFWKVPAKEQVVIGHENPLNSKLYIRIDSTVGQWTGSIKCNILNPRGDSRYGDRFIFDLDTGRLSADSSYDMNKTPNQPMRLDMIADEDDSIALSFYPSSASLTSNLTGTTIDGTDSDTKISIPISRRFVR